MREQYKKKERCKYPFTLDKANYCWGYACMVDEGRENDADRTICKDCEFYDTEKAGEKQPTEDSRWDEEQEDVIRH